jgi:predicted transcriptional regulator
MIDSMGGGRVFISLARFAISWQSDSMRIKDTSRSEGILEAIAEPDCRRILALTMGHPLSVTDVSAQLSIPVRSAYRYVEDLCSLGLLTGERGVVMKGGGRYLQYRSMVKSVTLTYQGDRNSLEVDMLPNEGILDRFLRFWTYMSG